MIVVLVLQYPVSLDTTTSGSLTSSWETQPRTLGTILVRFELNRMFGEGEDQWVQTKFRPVIRGANIQICCSVLEVGKLHCSFDHGLCDWISTREGDLDWETVDSPAGKPL